MITDICNETSTIKFNDFDNITIIPSSSNSSNQYFKKTNYFPENNILFSDKNNKSKTWPVMNCNLNKEDTMNTNIFKRNFADINQEVLLDPRPSFQINCKYIHDNKDIHFFDINGFIYY